MCNIMQVADAADVIVNGYAFTKVENRVRVLNLNKPDRAAFISQLGEVLETSIIQGVRVLSLLYLTLYYRSYACTCK